MAAKQHDSLHRILVIADRHKFASTLMPKQSDSFKQDIADYRNLLFRPIKVWKKKG